MTTKEREYYKIDPDTTVEYSVRDGNGGMVNVVDTPGVSNVKKYKGPDNMGWTTTTVPGQPAVTKHDYANGLRGNLIDPNTSIEYSIKHDNGIVNYLDTPSGTSITGGNPMRNPNNGDVFGVRQAMSNFGLKDTDIGYNNGIVTYAGQNFMTPTVNENGTTKASASDIIKAMNSYYQNTGQSNQINAVADTVAGMGLANSVEYGDNGVVTIGGMPLKNVNIMNGVAYAPYSEIVATVNKFKQANKYQTPIEIFNSTLGKDEEKIRGLSRQIGNFKDFKYDPEKDIAYQVYKEQYLKNAQKAADDTWGRNTARSGGYANSAAVAASDQAYYDHMSELDNIIPLLMDKAYVRHRDKLGDLYDELSLYGTPREYEADKANAYNSNADLIDAALKSEYDKDWAEREFAEGVRQFDTANEITKNYQNEYWKRYDEDREYKKGYDEKDFALREQALDIQRAMAAGGGGGGDDLGGVIMTVPKHDPMQDLSPEDKANYLINQGLIDENSAAGYMEYFDKMGNGFAEANSLFNLPAKYVPKVSSGGGGGGSRSTTKKKSSSGDDGEIEVVGGAPAAAPATTPTLPEPKITSRNWSPIDVAINKNKKTIKDDHDSGRY